MQSKPKVFLSHSKKDVAFINALDSSLRQCQCETWIDEIEIRHGRPWLDEIFRNGIPSCEIVLCYITEHSIESSMVSREIDARLIERMQNEQVTILPYISHTSLRGKLRLDLQSLQIPELNEKNYREMLPKIVAEVWRSHSDWSVSRAIQSYKIKLLESELKIKELQEASSASIFLNRENSDFKYIWSKIDRRSPFSVAIQTTKGETPAREVNYTIDYGQLYLTAISTQTFEFHEILCKKRINDAIAADQQIDLKGLLLNYDIEIDFEALLLTVGFFRRITRDVASNSGLDLPRFLRQQHELAFTERFDRFNYWLSVQQQDRPDRKLLTPGPSIDA